MASLLQGTTGNSQQQRSQLLISYRLRVQAGNAVEVQSTARAAIPDKLLR
jgi:hypothetical protein